MRSGRVESISLSDKGILQMLSVQKGKLKDIRLFPFETKMMFQIVVSALPRSKCYRISMATQVKPDRLTREPALGGPITVVETACPLDCPDACSLAVTVQTGKIITIDGSRKNPVTDGYICAKVRRFGERVYGPDRLLYPAIRTGPKGAGTFARTTWDEALELVASRFEQAKAQSGGRSI